MHPVISSETADLVSDLLERVNVKSALFCRSTLNAPCGMEISARDVMTYHLVEAGGAWLEVEGEPAVQLGSGDLVILARGDRHKVRNAKTAKDVALEELLTHHPLDEAGNMTIAGPEPATVLICGGIEIGGFHVNPLIPLLPRVLRVNVADEPWLSLVLEGLSKESLEVRPARSALVNHLGSLLFLACVRRLLEEDVRVHGVVSALGDTRLMKATALMIDSPERDWDMNELARCAGMSRTGFSRLFSTRTGQTPGDFLRRCRIARALELMRETRRTLEDIAEAVGYGTTPAFSRAFKTICGVSPSEYRNNGDREPLGEAIAERETNAIP